MRGSVKIPTLIVLMCVLAVPAFAERKDKPTGEEIANKAKAAKFDSANSTAGEKIGKKVKLTPAKLDHVKSEAELEGGQIIGMLETEAPGDETGLPPGKYNVFAAKVGNDWHVYAESGGKIVVEAVHVRAKNQNFMRKGGAPGGGCCLLGGWLPLYLRIVSDCPRWVQ